MRVLLIEAPGLPFIQKPFTPDELAKTVRQVLNACEGLPVQHRKETQKTDDHV